MNTENPSKFGADVHLATVEVEVGKYERSRANTKVEVASPEARGAQGR